MSVPLPDDKFNQWDEKAQSSSSPEAESAALPSNPKDEGFGPLNSRSDFISAQYEGRGDAFPLLDDVAVPEARKLRWEREALVRTKFASGDALFELRATVAGLRRELVDMRMQQRGGGDAGDARKGRIKELEDELLALNGRDAEFMHAVSSELMEKAQAAGHEELAEKYRIQVEEARLCIPQLNMHGLWVGKYGENGYEIINITYSGDTLVATKVTGDQNVPRGKESFTVDLSPQFSSKADGEFVPGLEPIELNPKAAKQWGKHYLPRHAGWGQVASRDFTNAQWMEGQMILVGKFFSFAWVPIGHQVFFGRPSAELVVKMMREAKEEELRKDHVAVMRDAAEGMWDETYWDERERPEENYYVADDEQDCFQ